MRSIALAALFVLALGTGCASQRTKSTYVTRAPSYAPRVSYSSYGGYAATPRYAATRVVRTRSAAPVYGSGYGRRVVYASRVPPPPPPPPLYSSPTYPSRTPTVVYSARSPSPRRVVTTARRPAPPRSVPATRAPARASPVPHKGCVSFVGGFAGVLPASSCST